MSDLSSHIQQQGLATQGIDIDTMQSACVQDLSLRVKQPHDAFLVLDVEATCLQGTGFHWPSEIIVRVKKRLLLLAHLS